MFDVATISDKAIGLVGFRQDSGMDASLQESRSGLFFEGASPLVQRELIEAVIPQGRDLTGYTKSLIKESYIEVLKKIFAGGEKGGAWLIPATIAGQALKFADRQLDGFIGYEITLSKPIWINGAKGTATVTAKNGDTEKELTGQFRLTPGVWEIGYNVQGNEPTANFAPELPGAIIFPIYRPTGQDTQVTGWISSVNFWFSFAEDYTDLITNNEAEFARALQLQFAARILSEAVNSIRSNRVERIGGANALFELDGSHASQETPEHEGVVPKLAKEIKTLRRRYIDYPLTKQTLL